MPSMHRQFSRWMHPLPQSTPGIAGWVAIGVIGAALIFVLLRYPVATLITTGAVALASVISERRRTIHVRKIAASRPNEDIGSFARAFDRRGAPPFDPWAVRAVWNAVGAATEANGQRIPLRPTDRLVADLDIDAEEIEYLVPELVEQCERVPGDWKANPYNERLATVGDLVYFISSQPVRGSS